MDEYLDDIEKELAEHWADENESATPRLAEQGARNRRQFSDKCARLRDLRDRIVGILGQYGEDY